MRIALFTSCCLLLACANDIDETPNNLLPPPRAAGPCADMLKAGDWYRFEVLRLKSIGSIMIMEQIKFAKQQAKQFVY